MKLAWSTTHPAAVGGSLPSQSHKTRDRNYDTRASLAVAMWGCRQAGSQSEFDQHFSAWRMVTMKIEENE